MKRRPSVMLILIGLGLILVSTTVGYVASAAVRSPAQVLADSAAPGRTTLTEPVTIGRVTRTVSFDGEVQRQFTQTISASAGLTQEGEGIVTQLPKHAGDDLTNGELAVEVSGRPVFVLHGKLPAYRSLQPGVSGPDVAQLQRALLEAGYRTIAVDGVYGPSTAAAVQSMYRSHGHEADVVGAGEVHSASRAVDSAQRDLARLTTRHAKPLDLRFAREDLAEAKRGLEKARAHSGARVNLGEIVFLAHLPATIDKVHARPGAAASGKLLTLHSGNLVVRGAPVAEIDARRIHRGLSAELLMSTGGEKSGRVSGFTSKALTEEDPSGASSRTFTIKPTKHSQPGHLGASVRIIVTVARAKKAGLVVPLSAIFVGQDGCQGVSVLRDGRQHFVPVSVPFSGDGRARITPAEPEALRVGDEVVIGIGLEGQ